MTNSTIFPDLMGLAKELEERFWYPETIKKEKLDRQIRIKLKMDILESDTREELSVQYIDFRNNPKIHSIERRDFAMQGNKYLFIIDYWESV